MSQCSSELWLDVRLSGKVCAYLVSRNSQPVVKKSPANVKSMGYRDIWKSTCKLLAEVPAGSRINFEGLAFASKAILRKETFGCCGQPPSSTPSTEQLQHFGKNPDNPFKITNHYALTWFSLLVWNGCGWQYQMEVVQIWYLLCGGSLASHSCFLYQSTEKFRDLSQHT